jgi:hypothetical protein
MKIILDEHDLNRLSIEGKEEILKLIHSKIQNSPKKMISGIYEPVVLTLELAGRMIQAPINEKTLKFLKVFADNEGTVSLEQILNVTGYRDIADLKGVHTGLLKRLRKITGIADAFLYLEPSQMQIQQEDNRKILYKMPKESADALNQAMNE